LEDYISSQQYNKVGNEGNLTIYQSGSKYVVLTNSTDDYLLVTDKNLDEAKKIASSADFKSSEQSAASSDNVSSGKNNGAVFDKDTVVTLNGLNFTIPEGYKQMGNQGSEYTFANNTSTIIISIKNIGKPYYRELRDKAWKILYGDTSSGNPSVAKAKLAELYPDIQQSKYSYRDERRTKFDYEYITKPFESTYGSLKYAQSVWDLDDEKIHANNQRDGENLILDLLKRVTKITGPVRDWSQLHVTQGNQGAVINGLVYGEDGAARVDSILAGGYNVQRLHVRTLVKPVK
jgi:hypothetical protein